MTPREQQLAAAYASRFLGLSPHEWITLPPEIKQLCLAQPIGDDD